MNWLTAQKQSLNCTNNDDEGARYVRFVLMIAALCFLVGCQIYPTKIVRTTVEKKEPKSAAKLRENVANALKR